LADPNCVGGRDRLTIRDQPAVDVRPVPGAEILDGDLSIRLRTHPRMTARQLRVVAETAAVARFASEHQVTAERNCRARRGTFEDSQEQRPDGH
jgi:hypothetical protein